MPAKPPQKTKACPTGGFSDVLEAWKKSEGKKTAKKCGTGKKRVKPRGGGCMNIIFIYSIHVYVIYIYIYILCIAMMTIVLIYGFVDKL